VFGVGQVHGPANGQFGASIGGAGGNGYNGVGNTDGYPGMPGANEP
jgi:hypothetical protein